MLRFLLLLSLDLPPPKRLLSDTFYLRRSLVFQLLSQSFIARGYPNAMLQESMGFVLLRSHFQLQAGPLSLSGWNLSFSLDFVVLLKG